MKNNIHNELFRKLIHIFFGLFFILLYLYSNTQIVIFSSLLLTLAAILNKFIFKKIKIIYKRSFSLGTILYPLSIALIAWLWLPTYPSVFIFAILILSISDSAAALFGSLSSKKLPFFNKTISGSSSFFITTLIISLLLYKKIEIVPILTTSLILTIVEFFFVYGLDNLTLTIIASYLFYYFNF